MSRAKAPVFFVSRVDWHGNAVYVETRVRDEFERAHPETFGVDAILASWRAL